MMTCTKAGGTTQGRRLQNLGEQECAACKLRKKLVDFQKQDLNDKQKKEKAGASYRLVCTKCKARQTDLVNRVEQLDVRLCPRSCGTQVFRHSERCKAKFRVRLTEEDLEFLSFRPGNVTKYWVRDVAYYRRLGVIESGGVRS